MGGPGLRDSVNEFDDDDIRKVVDVAVAGAIGAASAGLPPVTGLNPEAGNHVVTTDPLELRAALRAGELTRRRFAYYERRYGERGRRFTHSDSAWIVTVAGWPPEVAERHLRWLGGLLAARGMPRWLLEAHLEALHAELVAAVPAKQAAYDGLLRVAAVFRAERQRHLDESSCSQLVREFNRRVGSAAAAELPEAGTLLVAAVAEERAGLPRVVASLTHWLADPARFTARWVTAATDTVAEARKRVR